MPWKHLEQMINIWNLFLSSVLLVCFLFLTLNQSCSLYFNVKKCLPMNCVIFICINISSEKIVVQCTFLFKNIIPYNAGPATLFFFLKITLFFIVVVIVLYYIDVGCSKLTYLLHFSLKMFIIHMNPIICFRIENNIAFVALLLELFQIQFVVFRYVIHGMR